jgi:hypothetical protein
MIVGARLAQMAPGEPWTLVETATLAAPGEALTPEMVRRVRLGDLLARARRYAEGGADASPSVLSSPSEIDLAEFTSGRRGVPISDHAYARLALHYVLMVREGNRKPAQTLSDQLGHGSPNQWTQRVREARRRGLLSPATPGEPGGVLTDAAMELLDPSASPSNPQ